MSLNNSNIAVIVGSANKELGHKICKIIGINPTKSEVITLAKEILLFEFLRVSEVRTSTLFNQYAFPLMKTLWNYFSGLTLFALPQQKLLMS